MTRRRLAVGLLLLAAVVLVVGGLVIVPGRYDTVPRRPPGSEGVAWARPCAAAAVIGVTWTACGRVTGRAVWVEDRDADGDGDRHVVLASRGHLRVVKIAPNVFLPRSPRIGDRIEAVGPVTQGSRTETEIDAQRVELRGPVGL